MYCSTLEVKRFELPTRFIHNLAFGGPNLNELFVTSGRLPFDLYTGGLASDTVTVTVTKILVLKVMTEKY